ncbi:VOC family protein [Paractinoplanes lichenicola]|uniref:VOC family protein n=1 Tax=Paractinoplanes lichenicola TaxID=2802976 RepID=A0ABS1VXR4_9ACTN|nr:VOC family protein [Actinoplanes lichenicola]MBL7259286.1 VOC family protein [Actinoplanes lichenicola]
MGRGLVPYLCCPDAAAAIEFYVSVFGATEVQRWTADDGRIGHAELSLAGEPLFLADEHPEIGVRGPLTYGGTPVSFVLGVADPDAIAAKAVAAGATVERPVAEQDDGSRAGWIIDPYGHRWNLQNRGVELPVDQLRERVGGKYTITE